MKKLVFLVIVSALAVQGLRMLTEGSGVPRALAAPAASDSLPGAPGIRTRQARPGVATHRLRQQGRVTVVEYFTTWCPACRSMPRNYSPLLEQRPDVSVQRVQLPDQYEFPYARRDFGIRLCSVPHITIFDAEGEIVAEDTCSETAGTETLFDWINAEIRDGA